MQPITTKSLKKIKMLIFLGKISLNSLKTVFLILILETNLLEKMLDKDPITRITPEVALKHPYFIEEVDDEDEIPA